MIGYPYIQNLFQTILNNSMVIQGRFYVCPKWGAEMNNPNITEALAIGEAKDQKWPAAMMMPPPKEGNFEYGGESNSSGSTLWDIYTINILFVGPALYTGQNQISEPNGANVAQHTIQEMWHDMDRVAEEFCAVLQQLICGVNNIVFWDSFTPKINLITNLGNDKVSGVKLTFKLGLFSGCTIEDYPSDFKTSIVIPDMIDTHPIHNT